MLIKQVDSKEAGRIYRHFILKYFPRDERKPLSHIRRMMARGYYKVIVAYEEAESKPLACALLVTAPGADTYLLDYLAVHKNCRSQGIGAQLLGNVASTAVENKPILIETESLESSRNAAETKERQRRNAFYQRNSAQKTDLVTNVFGVEYNIWVLNPTDLDFSVELRKIYHFMVSEKLYQKCVHI